VGLVSPITIASFDGNESLPALSIGAGISAPFDPDLPPGVDRAGSIAAFRANSERILEADGDIGQVFFTIIPGRGAVFDA